MKAIIKNIMLAGALVMGFASCSTDSELANTGTAAKGTFAVSVTDNGFTSAASNAKSRATTSAAYKTTFESGDAMGVYVVNSAGTSFVKENIKLTYDGTSWHFSTTDFFYDPSTMSGYKYFAYYPYQSTIADTQKPTASTTSEAATFFANLKTNWTIPTDQSTAAKFAQSDLMVGAGTMGSTAVSGAYPLNFVMTHQMSLVEMQFPYYYLSSNTNYTFTYGLSFTDFTPYKYAGGTYRYIVKAGAQSLAMSYISSTTTSAKNDLTFTPTTSAGKYHQIFINGTAKGTSYTPVVGDYITSSGSIVPNANTNTYLGATYIGVVFSTSTSTNDQTAGYKSGYALALKNVQTGNTKWSSTTAQDIKDQPAYASTSIEIYKTDMDGYTHCKNVASGNGSTTYSLENYSAIYWAKNFGTSSTYGGTMYAAPSNTSGWYLPSMGQWYTVYLNLGGVSAAAMSSTSDGDGLYGLWNGISITTSDKISAYITKAGTYVGSSNVEVIGCNSSTGRWFWTSTEFSASLACHAYFGSADDLALAHTTKSFTDNRNRVRAVLAF